MSFPAPTMLLGDVTKKSSCSDCLLYESLPSDLSLDISQSHGLGHAGEIQGEVLAPGTFESSTTALLGTAINRLFSGLGNIRGHATMIDILPDDVLLDILSYTCAYNKWVTLVHVCRRWRQLVFSFPYCLRIQLLCTPGTPVRMHLSCWPVLPIILEYDSLTRSDEDHLIAALEHSSRVCKLSLTVKNSQVAKLVTVMQEPYPALEYLGLTFSSRRTAPALPGRFLGGSVPHLRVLEFEAVPFPALPALLASANDLEELRLDDIPKSGYISPEAMVAALASLTHLEVLHIGFKSPKSHPDKISLPPVTRTVLPALMIFEFEGASDYLEDLVARIDCPKLRWIKIWYLHRRISFRADQLLEFIDRSENDWVRQFRWIDIIFYSIGGIRFEAAHIRHSVSTSVTFQGTNWGVAHLIQMFRQFTAKLSQVRHLSIDYDGPGTGMGQNEWEQVFRPFTAVKTLHVVRDRSDHDPPSVEDVPADMATGTDHEMLPALGLFFLETHPAYEMFSAFFENFVATRQRSSCPVTFVTCKREFEEKFRSYLGEDDKDIFRFEKIYPSGYTEEEREAILQKIGQFQEET